MKDLPREIVVGIHQVLYEDDIFIQFALVKNLVVFLVDEVFGADDELRGDHHVERAVVQL